MSTSFGGSSSDLLNISGRVSCGKLMRLSIGPVVLCFQPELVSLLEEEQLGTPTRGVCCFSPSGRMLQAYVRLPRYNQLLQLIP